MGSEVKSGVIDLAMEKIKHKDKDFNQQETVSAILTRKIEENDALLSSKVIFFAISCLSSFQYVPTIHILNGINQMVARGDLTPSYIVVGGYHPTIVPNDFNGTGVDFIVSGEGERSLVDIIQSRIQKPKQKTLTTIPKIVQGTPFDNLDDLPPINFSIYEDYLHYYPRLSIALSRGCPLRCNFCIEKKLATMNAASMRWRAYSPKRAQLEIEEVIGTSERFLKKEREKIIGLYDPIFGFNRTWREKVLDSIINMESEYTIWGETRVDNISSNDLHKLKKARLHLMLGFESGSPKILSLMNKTKKPLEYLKNMERLLVKCKEIDYGPFALNLISNFPGENLSTIDETFQFLKRLTAKGLIFTIPDHFYNFFPGDNIYNETEKWESNHGTTIHFKEWWKNENTVMYADVIDASRSLTYEDAAIIYRDKFKILYKDLMDNVEDVKYKFEFLKTLRNVDKKFEYRMAVVENEIKIEK
ncbi:MAG: B12-binding domain-containing radical SAM protein [Promethearchaeota archaeon]